MPRSSRETGGKRNDARHQPEQPSHLSSADATMPFSYTQAQWGPVQWADLRRSDQLPARGDQELAPSASVSSPPLYSDVGRYAWAYGAAPSPHWPLEYPGEAPQPDMRTPSPSSGPSFLPRQDATHDANTFAGPPVASSEGEQTLPVTAPMGGLSLASSDVGHNAPAYGAAPSPRSAFYEEEYNSDAPPLDMSTPGPSSGPSFLQEQARRKARADYERLRKQGGQAFDEFKSNRGNMELVAAYNRKRRKGISEAKKTEKIETRKNETEEEQAEREAHVEYNRLRKQGGQAFDEFRRNRRNMELVTAYKNKHRMSEVKKAEKRRNKEEEQARREALPLSGEPASDHDGMSRPPLPEADAGQQYNLVASGFLEDRSGYESRYAQGPQWSYQEVPPWSHTAQREPEVPLRFSGGAPDQPRYGAEAFFRSQEEYEAWQRRQGGGNPQ